MATGLLIRDFFKEYRELRYSNSGSIALSEIEHNAYRASLTLEITHIDAPRYGSLKTLPENTHYGYVTLFRGSTVTETIPIKYPKFRVFDINNQGIWNYHQATESLQILGGVSVGAANEVGRGILSRLGDLATGTICFVGGLRRDVPEEALGWEYILDFFDCDEPDGGAGSISSAYRGFPVATPFPDIAKFKADVPVSFLWRLETWYLVNPAVYIVDNPTDTGDETDGEDEYPVPEQGDGDGDGSEFPPSDAADPNADPRDFGGGNGVNAPGVTNVFADFVAYPNPQFSNETVSFRQFLFQVPGEMQASEVVYSCGATIPPGNAVSGKCIAPRFAARGQSVEFSATIEDYRVVTIYFPQG